MMQSMKLIVAAIMGGSLLGCVQTAETGRVETQRTETSKVRKLRSAATAPEAAIGQAIGRVFSGNEGAANTRIVPVGSAGVGAGSPGRPTTCGQQNTADPACHTATQQARPPTR